MIGDMQENFHLFSSIIGDMQETLPLRLAFPQERECWRPSEAHHSDSPQSPRRPTGKGKHRSPLYYGPDTSD